MMIRFCPVLIAALLHLNLMAEDTDKLTPIEVDVYSVRAEHADSLQFNRASLLDAYNLKKGSVSLHRITDYKEIESYMITIGSISKTEAEEMPFDVYDTALVAEIDSNDNIIWKSRVEPVTKCIIIQYDKNPKNSELILFSDQYLYRGSNRYHLSGPVP